jgi:hypothetical protein
VEELEWEELDIKRTKRGERKGRGMKGDSSRLPCPRTGPDSVGGTGKARGERGGPAPIPLSITED